MARAARGGGGVMTDIDEIILSVARPQWLKVAMILARARNECEHRQITIELEQIAEHVVALVDKRRLESQGDISNWRHSEVRLPT
jgi:hypothetical protein